MPNPLTDLLLPNPPRYFRGERWVNIVLRSLHLVGVAGIGGGFLFDLDPGAWQGYWLVTLATGVVLALIHVWCTAAWLLELKGLAIVIKTMMLSVAVALPAVRAELFIAIVILSGLIAHAPARVRAYRWLRIVDTG